MSLGDQTVERLRPDRYGNVGERYTWPSVPEADLDGLIAEARRGDPQQRPHWRFVTLHVEPAATGRYLVTVEYRTHVVQR